MPSCDPALGAAHVVRFLGRHRLHRCRHGAPGLRPPAYALRRARLACDVLHDGDGTLANERDGTGWERTPWHARQRAAWEALRTVSI
jgi:hypothetical protein